jgi:hypothetical protein
MKNYESYSMTVKRRILDFVSFYISQHDFKVDELLAKFEDNASEEAMTELFKPLVRMSYARKLQQQVDERFHRYIPQPEEAKALQEPQNLRYCKEAEESDEAKIVIEKLNNKEPAQSLKETLETFQLTPDQKCELLTECMLLRTKKSLEHLKRFIEIYYRDVIEPLYASDSAQKVLINTIIRIWGHNLAKCVQVVQKLH